jgi:hypothetical protein
MIPKDHLELDLSPLLDEYGIKQYQSLIGPTVVSNARTI